MLQKLEEYIYSMTHIIIYKVNDTYNGNFFLGLCEDDYEKLIKCLPLTLNNYNNLVLAAGYNVIASLCSDEIARHYFGEKITTCTVNILKSLLSSEINKIYFQECILQICRAIGNLCYYHGK